MIAAAQTVEGVVLVDTERETVLGEGTELPETDAPAPAPPSSHSSTGARRSRSHATAV